MPQSQSCLNHKAPRTGHWASPERPGSTLELALFSMHRPQMSIQKFGIGWIGNHVISHLLGPLWRAP
jgi:hypothetical protein